MKSDWKIVEDEPVSKSSSEWKIVEDEPSSSGFPLSKESVISALQNFRGLGGPLGLAATVAKPALTLGQDIIGGLSKSPDVLNRILNSLPSEISGTSQNINNDPARIGRQALAGAGDIVQGAINTPRSAASYAAHLGLIPQEIPNAMPEPYDFTSALDRFVGEDKKPGDSLIRGITRNLPMIIPGAGLAMRGISAGGRGLASTGKGLTNYGKVANARNVVEEAKISDQAAAEALKEVKGLSTREGVATDPNKLIYQLKNKQDLLDKLNQENKSLSPTEMPNLENAELAHASANNLSSQTDEALAQHLNVGATHALHASSGLSKRINSIENYWNQSYKSLKNDLKESKFEMPNIDKYKVNMDEVLAQMKLGIDPRKIETNSELRNILKKAPTSIDSNASDFLTKYQSFRDARYDLLQRAKNEPDANKRSDMFKAYEQSKDAESIVKNALDEGLGDFKPEFQRVNEGYSQQVFPLRENKVAQKVRSGKNLSENIAKELSGREPGQALMRDIAKSDPEVLRNIVGQRYAVKPNEIHNPNELMREYTNEMPDLQKLLDTRNRAKESILSSKQHLENTQKQQKYQTEYKNIQDEISKIDEHLPRLQEMTKRKDISLKDKMTAERLLRQEQQKRKTWLNKLIKFGKRGAITAIGLGGVGYGTNRLYND